MPVTPGSRPPDGVDIIRRVRELQRDTRYIFFFFHILDDIPSSAREKVCACAGEGGANTCLSFPPDDFQTHRMARLRGSG